MINWLTGQINASNNQLEAAVASFEAVLKTRIPERKFDFGLDFLVIDEMASALYTMARPLPVKSQERKKWLTKAIAAYHRTLAIDSEDVGAHYGLGLAFGDPAWGDRTLENSESPGAGAAAVVDSDELIRLAAVVADRKTEPAQRKDRALELARLVVSYMKGSRPRFQSRLEPLHDLSTTLGAIWEQETAGDLQAAIGRALEVTHKTLHERLKPDETAEGRVFAIARKNDPAANMNAQSIVIHSLHRHGAPGIVAAPAAAAAITTPPTPVHAQESGE